MLLDEDPATLIQHTIGNFNITPDKLAVARINDSLSTLEEARSMRVRTAEIDLKKLSRTLATLNAHHAETVASHSPTSHASLIADLDTQKFRIAKSASDLEIESERLSSTLLDLQSRLSELESQGVDDGHRSEIRDETTLKLSLYRGLGIGIEREGEGEEYTRAIVRNNKKGDVHVVNMDGKFSRFFYANYFWGTL